MDLQFKIEGILFQIKYYIVYLSIFAVYADLIFYLHAQPNRYV